MVALKCILAGRLAFAEEVRCFRYELRRELLESALSYYERFLRERGQDLLNLAEMHCSLSQHKEASRYSHEGLRLVEALVTADPKSFRYQHLLSDGCRLLAALLPPGEGLPVVQRGHAALARLCQLAAGISEQQRYDQCLRSNAAAHSSCDTSVK